jgi:hypothetical protein
MLIEKLQTFSQSKIPQGTLMLALISRALLMEALMRRCEPQEEEFIEVMLIKVQLKNPRIRFLNSWQE